MSNRHGFAPILLLLIVAAIGVIAISSSRLGQTKNVQGLEIAKGGDDSSGSSGESGNGSTSGSSRGGGSETENEVKTTTTTIKVSPVPFTKRETENENEVEIPESEKIEFNATNSAQNRKQKGKFKAGSLEIENEDNETKITSGTTSATVKFPLTFDKVTGQLFVTTGNGIRQIRILPDQASEVAKNAGIQNEIDKIEIIQNSKSGIDATVFKLTGKKTGKLFGIFDINQAVETEVGTQTGNVVSTNEPLILQIFAPFIR